MRPDHLLEHLDFVKALARSLVFGHDRAEDLAQQTCLAALQHPPRREGVRAWLAKVARNAARKEARSDRRREHHEQLSVSDAHPPTPEEVLERERLRRRIVDAVLALDEPYRTTVLLRYFENLTPTEIGGRLGASVDTVKTRLKRSMHRLRATLDRECGDRQGWSMALMPLMGLCPAEAAALTAAASHATGVLLMTANMKIAIAGILLLGGALAAWEFGAGEDPVPEVSEVQGAARSGVSESNAGRSSRSAEPAREIAESVPETQPKGAVPSSSTPKKASEAEIAAEYARRLKTAADSFRTGQPDYMTWFTLVGDLAEHAKLVEGSVYEDERGRTRGRFELPGALFLSFTIDDDDHYKLGIKNLRTLLEEDGPFTELHAGLDFRVGDGGVESSRGQVMFRDYTYTKRERQTLGYSFAMDRFNLETIELTQRANPEQKGSWIYAPGEKAQIPFSDLEGANRWFQLLRGVKPR